MGVGFLGAGSYAQSHLLPNIPKDSKVRKRGILCATGASSRSVAERFGFDFCTDSVNEVLDDRAINTVFIASRHDSHAAYVTQCIEVGKHVFVEKPLCLKEEELLQIRDLYSSRLSDNKGQKVRDAQPLLMVGYNRRFSPAARKLKAALTHGPMAITYRVNAGAIPTDSWIQDQEIGGGRIIGEVCHFIDFMIFLTGALPKAVTATAMSDPHHLQDTLSIQLRFADGSIGNIAYFSNGDKSLPKERIEVYAYGCTGIIDDFKKLTIHANGRKREYKNLTQDKGQKQEVRAFINAVLSGSSTPISLDEIFATSLTTFRILGSLRTGQTVDICFETDEHVEG